MKLKPLHVGISVNNIDESIKWYKDVLSFDLLLKMYVPPLEATIAFIKNGDFEIELFEYKNPKELPEERKHPDEDLKTVGTKHIAFYTSNYEELIDSFKKKNVDIVFNIVMEGNPTCYIRDNSGILIEFIQRK